MGKPTLPDISTLLQAGIDPKTGLPSRYVEAYDVKSDIKRNLRIMDEQTAVNRYKWYNLPNGLTGQMIERIIYYKGQAMFFYMETDETFYFLPYALDGTIDVYGRYTGVTPLPFNGKAQDKKDAWIVGLNRKPIYEVETGDIKKQLENFTNGCVLLHDYTKQIAQTVIPRCNLQEAIIDIEAEAFPFARTALLANSGIKGMRVNDTSQESNVKAASRSITKAALSGDPWIPIVGNVEFQDLTNGTSLNSEEFLLYMQALDNFRLSQYGLDNTGLFEKKAHTLQSEQDMNASTTGLIYQDGLTIRQRFCDLVNSIWGLGIWCDMSDEVAMMQADAMIPEEEPNEQPAEGGEEDE